MMVCKTRHARLRRAMQSVAEWCRRNRHLPVQAQHAALTRRLVGHFNYFGVNGNFRSLACLVDETKRVWFKWLCRRSQRRRLNWQARARIRLAGSPLLIVDCVRVREGSDRNGAAELAQEGCAGFSDAPDALSACGLRRPPESPARSRSREDHASSEARCRALVEQLVQAGEAAGGGARAGGAGVSVGVRA